MLIVIVLIVLLWLPAPSVDYYTMFIAYYGHGGGVKGRETQARESVYQHNHIWYGPYMT